MMVLDVLSREIRTIVNELLEEGRHERVLEAKGLASGVYFYRLKGGGKTLTLKLVLGR